MALSPADCWDHEGRCWSEKRWFWIGSTTGGETVLPRQIRMFPAWCLSREVKSPSRVSGLGDHTAPERAPSPLPPVVAHPAPSAFFLGARRLRSSLFSHTFPTRLVARPEHVARQSHALELALLSARVLLRIHLLLHGSTSYAGILVVVLVTVADPARSARALTNLGMRLLRANGEG